MSGEGGATGIRLSAGEIEAQAVEWIERRDFGTWGEADDEALETWLSKSLHHRVAFDRLDLGWQRTERLTVLRQSSPNPSDPVSGRRVRRNPIRILFLGAAVCASLAGWFLFPTDRQFTYATSIGGREIVRLVDGSQIELNTDTTIRILDRTDRREVWLDRGEAYFQVVHDAAHPFVVNAGARRVTDLGTKFLLRRDYDRLKVAVSEGGVRLESEAPSLHPQSVTLGLGDVAIATPAGLSIKTETTTALTNDLSWREGILIFHHRRLADAAAEFNRYNHKQIVIADPAIADLEIGGTFPTTDVDGFAEVTRDVLRLRVTKSGDDVRISR